MSQFQVVVNAERQHSLWPVSRDVPAGWSQTGFCGDRADCLEHIDQVITDIRPLSVITQVDRYLAERRLVEQRSNSGQPLSVPAGRIAADTGVSHEYYVRPEDGSTSTTCGSPRPQPHTA